MTTVRDVADRFIAEHAVLDPVHATMEGVLGHDAEMTDYSPAGVEARTELYKRTLRAVAGADVADDDERRGHALMTERLQTLIDRDEAGESLRALRVLASPAQHVRQVFDLMAHETEQEWETIAARMEQVPAALAGYREALAEGAARGVAAARRQAEAVADQAEVWAGLREAAAFFPHLAASATVGESLARRLDRAASAATDSYAALARYLLDEYAPVALTTDAVGRERYQLATRHYLGATIDLEETYRWGWDELHRIEADMARTADRVQPGATVEQAKHVLETDPARAIEGVDRFRDWMQELMDTTVRELNGRHFDIPEPVQRVEAMIAAPGGAAAMYYTPPAQDFSRPGRTWYPTMGKTSFPLWGEVSIAYHEGVPGHHLQVAQVRYLGQRLSAYQRSTFVSGHGEGWALYAERLMDELGYLDNPDYRLGMLRAQAMRAVRVVVDLGMHLELAIPDDEDFHPGARWTPDLGQAFVDQRSHFSPDFMASELLRYLGTPGQAISYKVGERVWLESRADLQRTLGSRFDLRHFHHEALDFGPLGLDQLRAELAAIGPFPG